MIFSWQSKLNCEVLWDDLAYEVRWAVAGDSIVLQLVSRLEDGEYMAFGISGDDRKSRMVGGDVTVAWVDKDSLKGQAKDYYLDAKSQCSGVRGSCPDENIAEKTNSVRLLNAALVNGYSIVTFQRSLKGQDEFDLPIYTNGTQPIIWAIGPLNARQEVSYHSIANRADILIDFGRPPKWNCPTPEAQSVPEPQHQQEQPKPVIRQQPKTTTETALDNRQQSTNRRDSARPKTPAATPAPTTHKVKPWDIPAIQCYEPDDGVFYAQMGPTGGKRGYPAITGHVGWGISWYINGLLIPEINVVRGKTYTFIAEGGMNPDIPAKYHPFYITDDPVGGYEYKTPEERAQVQIFAGAVQNSKGEVRPTGVGRLCNWTPDPDKPSDDFASFGAYQRTLRLICDAGEPGIVQWTVAKDTPDTVYYQCYTHRYLGWKINVVDSCDEPAGSDPQPVFVRPPAQFNAAVGSPSFTILDQEPEPEESIQHESKVRPENSINSVGPSKDPSPSPQPVFVPEFHFYNEQTGEPLDEETIQRMNLEQEIQQLQTQFFQKQMVPPPPTPKPLALPFQQLPNFSTDEQFLNFFNSQSKPAFPGPSSNPIYAPPSPKPTIHSYSVNEDSEEQSALPSHQFHVTPQTERTAFVQTTKSRPMHYETTTVDDRFNQEFLRNYHQLQAEAAAKLKKQHQKIHGKPARLQYSAPRRPSTSHHALTLQQRPLPPGMFRPPFMPPPTKKTHTKRPVTSGSQKVPTYASINSIPNRPPTYIRPHKPQRPAESYHVQHGHSLTQSTVVHPIQSTAIHPLKSTPHPMQSPIINMQQVLALEKLISTMAPHQPISHLPTTPIYKERPRFTTESSRLAINTGFNPSSVKVEGGFKPILSSGIAPSFKVANERMDDLVEETDVEDNIGVIDLTKEKLKEEAQEKVEQNAEESVPEVTNTTEHHEDIFKHLKPVMFEPMFVPSPPDTRIQKYPPKRVKKPIYHKHQGNLNMRNSNLEPYNSKNKYIKMRPRPTLIRRPLYPNNVMPPFKIPLRGGSPQFRYQHEDESIEDTTDFDIIQMNNDTINEEDELAENIFDVLDMDSDNSTEVDSMEVVVVNKDDGEIFENEFKVKNSTEDEIAMADDIREIILKPGSSLTYDGKVVSAISAPSSGDRPKKKFDITKLPQFAPFRGELPDLSRSVGDLPQSSAARGEILPPGLEASKRGKRSPDHVPGHVGDDHDHFDHEHGHDHDHEDKESAGSVIYGAGWLMALTSSAILGRFL